MSMIALIGLPGSGKTTLGRMLAERLSMPFIDVDREIERATGHTIAQLFEGGEPAFRDIERDMTAKLAGQNAVLSCGGGVVERAENVAALRESGLVIFLDRPVEAILPAIDISARPLLKGGRERLVALDARRRALYLAAAHAVVPNAGTPDEALEALVRAALTPVDTGHAPHP